MKTDGNYLIEHDATLSRAQSQLFFFCEYITVLLGYVVQLIEMLWKRSNVETCFLERKRFEKVFIVKGIGLWI